MTSRSVALLIWAVIGAVVLGLSALSAVHRRTPGGWPATPRAAVAALASSGWRRPVVLLGWMWLGWHLFAR